MNRYSMAVFLLLFAPQSFAATSGPFNGKFVFETNRDGNSEIYVMNPNGSGQTRLTVEPTVDANPAWSPDGTKIAFDSGRFGNAEILVMNADGSNPIRLTDEPKTDSAASWSPDGSLIAFHSARDGNFEIYVMNADGTNAVRLTNDPAGDFRPSWSPDSKKIVFRSLRDGINQIYVMNNDGTLPTRLSNLAFDDQEPQFTRDGTKIIFTRRIAGQRQLFQMNADGTSPVQLTSSGNNFNAAITPDGTKVAFSSDRDGNGEVYTMNLDGSNQTRLTNNAALDSVPSMQPFFSRNTVGVYRPSTGQWLLRNLNTAGNPDTTLTFGGQPGDLPVAGDWNGDGRTDIGIFRNGTFLLAVLKTVIPCFPCPPNTVIEPQPSVSFGQSGDQPIAGDWDGDGDDDLGVYRDGPDGTFLLRKPTITLPPVCPGCPPIQVSVTDTHIFGTTGDLPVIGDWDGDRKDTIGVFRPDASGLFLLTNDFTKVNVAFPFGQPGDLPLAGDWIGVGRDRLGVFRSSSAVMLLGTQLFAGPDITFAFGVANDLPVAGHWTPTP